MAQHIRHHGWPRPAPRQCLSGCHSHALTPRGRPACAASTDRDACVRAAHHTRHPWTVLSPACRRPTCGTWRGTHTVPGTTAAATHREHGHRCAGQMAKPSSCNHISAEPGHALPQQREAKHATHICRKEDRTKAWWMSSAPLSVIEMSFSMSLSTRARVLSPPLNGSAASQSEPAAAAVSEACVARSGMRCTGRPPYTWTCRWAGPCPARPWCAWPLLLDPPEVAAAAASAAWAGSAVEAGEPFSGGGGRGAASHG
jgi:hypothetical protein